MHESANPSISTSVQLARLESVKGLTTRLIQSGVVDARNKARLELQLWEALQDSEKHRGAERQVALVRHELHKPLRDLTARTPKQHREYESKLVMTTDGLIPLDAAEAVRLMRTARLLDRAAESVAIRSIHLGNALTASGMPYSGKSSEPQLPASSPGFTQSGNHHASTTARPRHEALSGPGYLNESAILQA